MTPKPMPTTSFSVKVVGLTFVDGYPENLYRLANAVDVSESLGEPLPAILIRNPANEHDPNAIEVHVPEVGMIGHVQANIAERFAPQLDAGERWRAEVEAVLIHPDHGDRPGITIDIRPVTDVEREGT